MLERATADFAGVAGVGIWQETGRFDPLPSLPAKLLCSIVLEIH